MRARMLMTVALLLVLVVVLAGLHAGSAQAGEPYDGFQPGFPGLHYDAPDRPAAISQDGAVQAAKKYVGQEVTAQATAIVARHVLLSDSQAYRVDERGEKHYLWQKAPVWVVTFEGVHVPAISAGRPPRPGEPPRPLPYHHEINIVVDANTGTVTQMFANR